MPEEDIDKENPEEKREREESANPEKTDNKRRKKREMRLLSNKKEKKRQLPSVKVEEEVLVKVNNDCYFKPFDLFIYLENIKDILITIKNYLYFYC